MGATNLKDPALKARLGELIGRGLIIKEAAKVIDVSESTAKRWARTAEVQAIARKTRESLMTPTVRSVLDEALVALKRDGSPDHATRLKAAQLLLTDPSLHPDAAQTSELPPGSIVLYPDE